MLKTITPSQMKRLEENYMNRTGTSALQLMESAARQVADAVSALCPDGGGGRVVCFCGLGGNGGDGMAAMRLLAAVRPELESECWLLPGSLGEAAEHQLRRLQSEAPAVRVLRLEDDDPPPLPDGLCCLTDAMFGVGLNRPLTGVAARLCARAGEARGKGVPVLAVDIPSGLDGESGTIWGVAVRATDTVTFHRPKPGLYRGYGLDFAGRVRVCSIGVPLEEGPAAGLDVLEPSDLSRLLPPRRRLSHKGSYGRVLLWVGSRGMAGAAAISATAALRAGAGLTTVACPESILSTVQTLCPSAVCLPLPEDDAGAAFTLLDKALSLADCTGIGCGLGQSVWAQEILEKLLPALRWRQNEGSLPAVIDADGLNLLSRSREAYGLTGCILTPHPAEAARLLQWERSQVLAEPEAAARELRARYGASVVLKNSATHLLAKEGEALNVLGTPAMAKGGSGDALTGVLTALLAGRQAGAYAMTDLELLQAACGLHGLAGMAAEKKYGQRGVLALDLCEELGRVPV